MRKLYWRGRNFRDLRRAINEPWQDWADNVFQVASGEPAGFDPATLTGIIGVYDVSDLASMTVGRDGSGGAPSVGDPVGTLADQAASGNDLAAPSDAARPVLRQTGGGLYYLEHDGVDDKLVSGTIATATAPIYIAIGAQKSGDIGRSFVGVVQDGSNQLAYLNNSAGRGQGLLRTTTLGVKLTVSTVGVFPLDTPAILESIGDGTNHIARVNGADEKTVAASPFTGLTSVYITTTDNALQHDLFGFVVRAGTANSGTDAADIRTWLADRNGATLA